MLKHIKGILTRAPMEDEPEGNLNDEFLRIYKETKREGYEPFGEEYERRCAKLMYEIYEKGA